MSTPSSAARAKRGAILRNTAILGVGLGIFQCIIWIISLILTPNVTSSPSLLAFIVLVAPLIWIIAFLLHGIAVGRRTGDSTQGALTGTFGGIFGGLVA